MHRKRLMRCCLKALAALPVFGQGGFLRAAKKARETRRAQREKSAAKRTITMSDAR